MLQISLNFGQNSEVSNNKLMPFHIKIDLFVSVCVCDQFSGE